MNEYFFLATLLNLLFPETSVNHIECCECDWTFSFFSPLGGRMRHTSLWSLKLFRDDDKHLQKYSEETAKV